MKYELIQNYDTIKLKENIRDRWNAFNPIFKFLAVLKGDNVYRYQATYELLDILMPDVEYINYGLWPMGIASENPGRELVKLVAESASLSSMDVVLNIGTGLGRPDIDIVESFNVRKIVGINICAEQVTYSKDLVDKNELSDRIEYLHMNAKDIGNDLANKNITAAISVEALTEVKEATQMLKGVFDLLPDGGPLAFADLILKDKSETSRTKRLMGRLLLLVSRVLFNNCWVSQSKWKKRLKKTGFRDLNIKSIGAQSFPYFVEFSRSRYSKLVEARIPRVHRILARLEISATNYLYRWGLIDYVLFVGKK